MPVKMRRPKPMARKITPEAIEAFLEKDLWRLHRALGLTPGEYSPLKQSEIGGYGYPPRQEHGELCIYHTRDQAIEIRRQILAAIAEEEAESFRQ
jgi:hypothetical protein